MKLAIFGFLFGLLLLSAGMYSGYVDAESHINLYNGATVTETLGNSLDPSMNAAVEQAHSEDRTNDLLMWAGFLLAGGSIGYGLMHRRSEKPEDNSKAPSRAA